MTKEEFSHRLCEGMANAQVSAQLHRRVLLAVQGKEEKQMKKKLSWAVVITMILLMICALAFAAAYRAGILDFAGRYPDSYVPKDAQDYIATDVLTLENDLVTAQITELYYDGRISRATVHIAPREPSALLLGPMTLPEDPWQNMVRLNGEWDESDTRTVADIYKEGGYRSAYSVDAWMQPLDGDTLGGSGDDNLATDGTLTLYSQVEYAEDQPVRDVLFRLYLSCYETPLIPDSQIIPEQTVMLEAPLTLKADTAQHETYVSTEPILYSDIGVRTIPSLTVSCMTVRKMGCGLSSSTPTAAPGSRMPKG